jgi:D-alanyl-lipoteichoic acid acyltransferase DltB (MBOAT superfamily)
MLFNSPSFLFLFLPLTLGVFHLLGRFGWRLALGWLTVMSFVFYAWWNPAYAWPMVVSILGNFACGLALVRVRGGRWGGPVLAVGIALNLAALGYFKYAQFIADNLSQLTGLPYALDAIVLPLGISFFTFTQIAYLVDVRRGIASEAEFLNYCLFVTFFPHLIAGPIIHHKEMMPQFARPKRGSVGEDLAVGTALFVIGLFKKVILADSVSTFPELAFGAAQPPGLLLAWLGALSYTAQIYFDFSGYSDMAVGLARLFGIDLPINFDSPYKAESITEFWRRWHMTLSRFLRDYLYFPLGGNRAGGGRRFVNLMLVMLIGGLWHGAKWTFVVWGGLHGLYLVINHLWRGRRGGQASEPSRAGRGLAWALTMLAVVVAWVFFRAKTVASALLVLAGMAGMNGLGSVGGEAAAQWQGLGLSLGLLVLAVAAPNSQQILRRYRPGLAPVAAPGLLARLAWQPSPAWAVGLAVMAIASVLGLWSASEFLYYQF